MALVSNAYLIYGLIIAGTGARGQKGKTCRNVHGMTTEIVMFLNDRSSNSGNGDIGMNQGSRGQQLSDVPENPMWIRH